MVTADAVKASDVRHDSGQRREAAALYRKDIEPNLKDGATLAFAHGFNIHYGQIQPPADADRHHGRPEGPRPHGEEPVSGGQGRAVPRRCISGLSGKARDIALAYAYGIAEPEEASLRRPSAKRRKRISSASSASSCGGVTGSSRAGSRHARGGWVSTENAYL